MFGSAFASAMRRATSRSPASPAAPARRWSSRCDEAHHHSRHARSSRRRAQAEPVVLAVDGKDIYVDLGANDGVGAGSELELLHEVVGARSARAARRCAIASRSARSRSSRAATRSASRAPTPSSPSACSPAIACGSSRRSARSSIRGRSRSPRARARRRRRSRCAPPDAAAQPPIDHAALARDAWQDTLGKPLERAHRALDASCSRTIRRRRTASAIEVEIASLRAQSQGSATQRSRGRSSTATDDRNPRIAQLAAQLAADRRATATLAIAGRRRSQRAVPGRPIAARVPRRAGRDRPHRMALRAPRRCARLHAHRARPRRRRVPARHDRRRAGHAASASTGTSRSRRADGRRREPGARLAGRCRASIEVDARRRRGADRAEAARTSTRTSTTSTSTASSTTASTSTTRPRSTSRTGSSSRSTRCGSASARCRATAARRTSSTTDHDGPACDDEPACTAASRSTFSYVYTEVEFRIRPNVALMLRPQAGLLTTDTMRRPAMPTAARGTTTSTGCEFFTGLRRARPPAPRRRARHEPRARRRLHRAASARCSRPRTTGCRTRSCRCRSPCRSPTSPSSRTSASA